ncbi:type I-F CRISPR-associated protein Csy1 [uncultured Alteromonas sp.]|uniref:type I-F CRISPR-associated protein Csy1 n=1 Tax=uncultured Alteromonas sp. TaxID=179113 RepID=UPI0030DBC69C
MTLAEAILNYIEQRKKTKLEPLDKKRQKVIDKGDDVAIAAANTEYRSAALPIEESFEPETWLTNAAKRAKQISLATHAAKFTHSDAKATSRLVVEQTVLDDAYLVTSSLKDKAIDAVGNAAALDVAKLLNLKVEDESLIDQIRKGSSPALSEFTSNAELLSSWIEGFKEALSDKELTVNSLTKQLYFLVSNNAESEYHLICPLFSSALCHQLHEKVASSRYGTSKEIRDARKAGNYHSLTDVNFPETAIQTFGGSKPQNISQLNSERYGQTFLLNASPPSFQSQVKPPLSHKTIFSNQFTRKVFASLREFKTFLENVKPHENNFRTRYKRDHYFVIPIIEQLLHYASSIQEIESGWALMPECTLKAEHALWLDINNENSSFQTERGKLNWLPAIANDFASWLLKQLKNDEHYLLGDVEHAYFHKLCLHHLTRFERVTPVKGDF